MKNTLALTAAFLLPFAASAVEAYLTMENDTFLAHQDNDYTHGTGLEVVDCPWHYKVGQNIYAPDDLTRKDHIVGDRPYAGILYGGVGYEFWRDPASPWTHYGEFDFGIIGPHSYSEQSQRIIHKLLGCRDPQGWDNQLHDEFVVNA